MTAFLNIGLFGLTYIVSIIPELQETYFVGVLLAGIQGDAEFFRKEIGVVGAAGEELTI
jgi:hypothetical protein